MNKKIGKLFLIREILYITVISLLGCTGIIFSTLYVDTFGSGFFAEYSSAIVFGVVGIISILTILTVVFYELSKEFVYKLFFLTVTFISICLLSVYLLKISGFLDKVDSIDDFRAFISSFESYAVILFVVIQFLQVVVLPIPGFITVGAGVLLFGPLKGAFLSCVGIISGSVAAFFVGRVFGYKVAKWLVGKDSLDKGLNAIKGKDKVVLTFMFLFPFFPDDVLCFVAGITTISPSFFIVMIFITRIISVFASSYSINGNIIPYNTWWGILIWIGFFAFTFWLTYLVYKKGDRIEKLFSKKVKKYVKH